MYSHSKVYGVVKVEAKIITGEIEDDDTWVAVREIDITTADGSRFTLSLFSHGGTSLLQIDDWEMAG